MRALILLSIVCLLFSLHTEDPGDRSFIIRISPDQDIASLALHQHKITILDYELISSEMGIYSMNISSPLQDEIVLDILLTHPDIATASENYFIEFRDSVPDDPRYDFDQPDMPLIDAPTAWCISTGGNTFDGREIVVGIVDDGFDIDHEDLIDNIWENSGEIPDDGVDNDNNGYVDDVHGWDTRENTGLIRRNNSHGTGTMGTIAAKGNNGLGITGVNWNIKIMGASITDLNARVDDVYEAYEYFIDNRRLYNDTDGDSGAFIVVVNTSLGVSDRFEEDLPEWCAYYDRMADVGILNVGATTNRRDDIDIEGDIPGTCTADDLIIVTDTNLDDELNAGRGLVHVDLSAPGDGTFTTRPDNNYGLLGGTSSAAPHVAGAIALAYSIPCQRIQDLINTDRDQFMTDIKSTILETVDPLTELNGVSVSGGRLNMGAFMNAMEAMCETGDRRGLCEIISVTNNPGDGTGQIHYKSPDLNEVTFYLYNTSGQLIATLNDTPSPSGFRAASFDYPELADGTYIFAMPCAEGENSTHKYLVRE